MPTRADHVVFAIPLDFVMYVELDALGVEWKIEIDGRSASIKFPALPQNAGDGRIVLEGPPGTPSVLAAHVELWGLVSEQSKVADIYTVVIAVQASAIIEWELENFPAAGADIQRLTQSVHGWIASFMRWVYCFTAQSLDTSNPDPKMIHRSSTNMIQAVTAGDRCTRPEIASLVSPIRIDIDGSPSSERVLSRQLVTIAASRAGTNPPAILELLASARLFMRRGDLRRALIDAGAAAEGAIVQRIGPSATGQTLGSLINICRTVEVDAQVNLVDPRNDAVHRSIAPAWAVAERAIEIVEDLVLQVEKDTVAAGSLRHVNRPQRVDLVIFKPSDKMVELSKARTGESQNNT
jgi:hypothetical protein